MKAVAWAAGAASIAFFAALAAGAQSRPAGGTTTYWMSAETMSGLTAGAAAQGGRPNLLGALMSGRGAAASPAFARTLTLQLASPRRAAGAPSAEHLPPASLGAGASLPLLSPQRSDDEVAGSRLPGQIQGAQGRILVYWGCGERAKAGQPFEIDLARLARGQAAAAAGIAFRTMSPPLPDRAGTFGAWPNERARTTIPAAGSLVGDHLVRGNYSPEIRFALAQGQDFLAPIMLTANSPIASGAVPVAWRAVPNARGYFVMATGARQDGTIVMWSSSEVQLAQMGLFDYLAPDEVARLVQQRVVLGPQTTQCTVPAEVAGSVEAASLMVNAFGPEANFSHPVRPANAGRNWAPEWRVKVRTRAAYTGMLGMDMEAMMRGDATEEREERPRRRRSPLERILGR